MLFRFLLIEILIRIVEGDVMISNQRLNHSRLHTRQEILQLTTFLPELCAPGFKPTLKLHGCEPDEIGVRHFPLPEYDPVVKDFFHHASQEQWCDTGYISNNAAEMLRKDNFIDQSSLPEIKTMLTYCVRSERICDGYWAMLIDGVISVEYFED